MRLTFHFSRSNGKHPCRRKYERSFISDDTRELMKYSVPGRGRRARMLDAELRQLSG